MSGFVRVVLFLALTASALPMALLAQTADYNRVVAQARADLSAGRYDAAFDESNDAIQLDASRWEAYLVAGSALQDKKPYDGRAVAYYTKALELAPEPKKAAVRDLLEQCKKLSAASSPKVSAPAATAEGPTFKETMDWLISKNDQEGYSYSITSVSYFSNGRQSDVDTDRETSSVEFGSPSDGTDCETTIITRSPGSGTALINLSTSIPNSIKVKSINVHKLFLEGTDVTQNGPNSILGATTTAVTKVATDHDIVYLIAGLQPFADGKQTSFELSEQTQMLFMPVYTDQDLAKRVAKALNHAIDVCGGKGKPEAF